MSQKSTEELIEELALSVARGFEEVDARMRQGFEEVNASMRQGFAEVNARLDRVEYHITGQEQRISVLEDRVRQLSTKVGLQYN